MVLSIKPLLEPFACRVLSLTTGVVFFLLQVWTVEEVRAWIADLFDGDIARKFEEQDIDGSTLQTDRLQKDESMEILGLTTLGKKG